MKHLLTTLLISIVAVTPIAAQDLPPEPATTFSVDCVEPTNTGVIVWFGYETNMAAHWMGSGFDFITVVGRHPRALSIIGEGDPPELPDLLGFGRWDESIPGIEDVVETVHLPITLPGIEPCDASPMPEEPLVEPTRPPVCLATAINSATGEPYCYQPTASGVIPLPPALQ
ncbi:MAG: hypothetical protein LCI00_05560 [Chloroflexi bacterium]|nr:hypothetical protein [Chloroflexota bacterium]